MNKMDSKRKQILFCIYMIGFLILNYAFTKINDKTGGYFIVLSLILLFFFLPFFGFLPVAIDKPLRSRLSKGQTKNANGLCRVAFYYTIVFAVILSLLLFSFAVGFTKNILQLPGVAFVIPYLVPGFVLLALCRALCMYFQGKGSGLQTVFSAAIMIVFSVLFGTVIGKPFAAYGQKVAHLMVNQDFIEQYLMIGIAIGIDIAAAVTFLFLLVAYFLAAGEYRRSNTTMRLTEHTVDSIRIFLSNHFPYWFASYMILIPIALSIVIFFEMQEVRSYALNILGEVGREKFIPCAISLFLVLSFVVLISAQISNWLKREEIRQGRDGFKAGLSWILVVSGFLCSCFVVLGSWKMGLFFMLVIIAYFFLTLLWQGGKRRSALISLFIAMTSSMTVSFLFSGMMQVDDIIFLPLFIQLGVMCVCTGFFLMKHYHFMPNWMHGFIFPILSSTVTGLIMYILQWVLKGLINGIFLTVVTLLIGLFVHTVICMALQCGNDNETLNLPGGKVWIMIGNRFHLFR